MQLKFALPSAMVSRHVARIAALRDLGGSAGTFKLSRISAATLAPALFVLPWLHPVNGIRTLFVENRWSLVSLEVRMMSPAETPRLSSIKPMSCSNKPLFLPCNSPPSFYAASPLGAVPMRSSRRRGIQIMHTRRFMTSRDAPGSGHHHIGGRNVLRARGLSTPRRFC